MISRNVVNRMKRWRSHIMGSITHALRQNQVVALDMNFRALSSNASSIPMVAQALEHGRSRVALVDAAGKSTTFGELLDRSAAASAALRRIISRSDMGEQCVAFLTPRNSSYLVAQWGVMRAGGTAVPLCTNHPGHSLPILYNSSCMCLSCKYIFPLCCVFGKKQTCM